MPKFHGPVGYGTSVEVSPGVYKDVITERDLYGDVVQNIRQSDDSDSILPDIQVQNQLSLVADAYALNHFFFIRYVKWQGIRWKVATVTVQPPRLLIRIGEVYNGPTPDSA